jgi:hypothetical protein
LQVHCEPDGARATKRPYGIACLVLAQVGPALGDVPSDESELVAVSDAAPASFCHLFVVPTSPSSRAASGGAGKVAARWRPPHAEHSTRRSSFKSVQAAQDHCDPPSDDNCGGGLDAGARATKRPYAMACLVFAQVVPALGVRSAPPPPPPPLAPVGTSVVCVSVSLSAR